MSDTPTAVDEALELDQSFEESEVVEAYYRGDMSRVTTLLQAAPERVRMRDGAGSSLLHYAAYDGWTEAASLLVRLGANVNSRNKDGRTALHEAAFQGDVAVAGVLLESGAQLECPDNQGQTPLMMCAGTPRCREVLELFLRAGAPVDLWSAIMLGRFDEVREELARNPEAVRASSRRDDLLIAALGTPRSAEFVELLLRYGADPNGVGLHREPPLCSACRLWAVPVQVVQMLLDHGADPHTQCIGFPSPLNIRPVTRRLSGCTDPDEVAELLRSHGAKSP